VLRSSIGSAERRASRNGRDRPTRRPSFRDSAIPDRLCPSWRSNHEDRRSDAPKPRRSRIRGLSDRATR
jgi:hypothetical protein